MDAIQLLESKKEALLQEANDGLNRSQCRHYHAIGREECRKRLQALFELTLNCVRDKDLIPMITYVEQMARERFEAGFDLQEVQIAFNVLEEVIWNLILREIPAGSQGEAIGLFSTVLGGGKDALARTYVSLASHSKTPSLDLSALFKGTGH